MEEGALVSVVVAISFIHLLSQPLIHFLDYVSYQ